MRRTAAILLAVVILAALGACSGTPHHGKASSTSSPTAKPSFGHATPQESAVPSNLKAEANPCHLVTAATVGVATRDSSYQLLATGYGDNPPVTSSFTERACAYTNSRGSTLTVTSDVDDPNGTCWSAHVIAGQAVLPGETSSGYRPAPGLGDAAFFSTPDMLAAHKGRIVVQLSFLGAPDDDITDAEFTQIMQAALAHVS